MMLSKQHWETVYTTKLATEVSWFQNHADRSLKLIRHAATPAAAAIIDIGGGASILVDDLLATGYEDITVLDLAAAALATAQDRLGVAASKVNWMEANVLEADFPESTYDVWHDRAVFHFLTHEEERQRYVHKVLKAVKPGGWVIIATFAEDGPTQCSGLPVVRYNAEQLHSEFGQPFELLGHEKESHYTPSGKEQQFIYCFCKKIH